MMKQHTRHYSSAECQYSNIERQALGTLHGLEKFHHYCFACEVHVITDHEPLVAIMGRDVATLSHCSQFIVLPIHQYSICILYKPGPELLIACRLPHHSHEENKDRGIQGLSINVNTINTTVDLQVCTSIQNIQEATARDAHL